MKKKGLALCGGGILGAFQAGFLYEISEKILFSVVSGSSIGAVNACLLYGGNAETLKNFWSDIGEDYLDFLPDPLKFASIFLGGAKNFSRPRVDFWNYILDGLFILDYSPFIEAIKKFVDFDKINALKTPLIYINATNIRTGKTDVFINNEINIDNLTASFSIPEIFPLKQINDKVYFDGAYTKNPAIEPFLLHGINELLIIKLLPETGKIPHNSEESKKRINEIIFSTPLRHESNFINYLNDLARKIPELKKEYQPIEISEICLNIDLKSYSPLMASKNFIKELFETGRKKALNII